MLSLVNNKMVRLVVMIFIMGLASYAASKIIDHVQDFGED